MVAMLRDIHEQSISKTPGPAFLRRRLASGLVAERKYVFAFVPKGVLYSRASSSRRRAKFAVARLTFNTISVLYRILRSSQDAFTHWMWVILQHILDDSQRSREAMHLKGKIHSDELLPISGQCDLSGPMAVGKNSSALLSSREADTNANDSVNLENKLTESLLSEYGCFVLGVDGCCFAKIHTSKIFLV